MEENEFEMAEQLAQTQRDLIVEKARIALEPQYSERFDGVNCIDCANEMPKERLVARRIRCTACQTLVEKREKQHSR